MRIAGLHAYPVKSCAAIDLETAELEAGGLALDRRYAFVGGDGRPLTQRAAPRLATLRPMQENGLLVLDLAGLARLPIEECAPAVSEFLGVRVRLETGRFPDAEPVLVTTTGMLARLNRALGEPVGMVRFRPNVVLEGDAEDWATLRAAEAELERAAPCGRCEVTTIDQASGERRGAEPLRTLHERFSGNFGVYCRVRRAGRLRRGEPIEAC